MDDKYLILKQCMSKCDVNSKCIIYIKVVYKNYVYYLMVNTINSSKAI